MSPQPLLTVLSSVLSHNYSHARQCRRGHQGERAEKPQVTPGTRQTGEHKELQRNRWRGHLTMSKKREDAPSLSHPPCGLDLLLHSVFSHRSTLHLAKDCALYRRNACISSRARHQAHRPHCSTQLRDEISIQRPQVSEVQEGWSGLLNTPHSIHVPPSQWRRQS